MYNQEVYKHSNGKHLLSHVVSIYKINSISLKAGKPHHHFTFINQRKSFRRLAALFYSHTIKWNVINYFYMYSRIYFLHFFLIGEFSRILLKKYANSWSYKIRETKLFVQCILKVVFFVFLKDFKSYLVIMRTITRTTWNHDVLHNCQSLVI